jgi:hypothetical protein
MGKRCAEEDIEIKRGEVTGEWRRLHNEKLHDCTFQHVVFRDPNEEDQMGGACGMNGGEEMCVHYCDEDACKTRPFGLKRR